jgi:hypothetical protein
MPDQVGALDCRRVEPAAKPACQLIGRKPHSKLRQIEHVNAAMLRERLDDRLPPTPGAREAVHENDRLASAGDAILARLPVDHELPDLHEESVSHPGHWYGPDEISTGDA